jgi:hypothetical protein
MFPTVPLRFQLEALLLLQQQLTAKLQGMLPQQQLLQIKQQAAKQQQQQEQDVDEAAVGASLLQGLNPQNARMAAVYVLSQQQLLQRALEAVQHQTEVCLQWSTSSSSSSSSHDTLPCQQQQQQRSSVAAAEGATAARPAAPAGIQLHPQLQLCCCCNVLSVREAQGSMQGTSGVAAADAGSNTSRAAVTDADQGAGVPCGEVLLDAAVASCAAAGTEADLILLLVAAAAAAQQQQQQQQQQREEDREEAQGQQLPEQQQPPVRWELPEEGWVQYYGQQWLAQWEVCAGGFEQVLPWWLVPANQELVGLLQGGCGVIFSLSLLLSLFLSQSVIGCYTEHHPFGQRTKGSSVCARTGGFDTRWVGTHD